MLPYLEKFIDNLRKNDYSEETVYNYERDLQTFNNFLDKQQKGFNSIDLSDIKEFINYLKSVNRETSKNVEAQKPLSIQSINRIISSIKSYLNFLQQKNYLCPISPNHIHTIRNTKKHPQVAELNDIIRLIESPSEFEKKNPHVALRNQAMLETLFVTGMRISELVNLNKNQIDVSGKIFIEGKGRKQRFVYLTDRAKQHVQKYLNSRSDNHPALFIPYRGSRAGSVNSRISPNYLQMKIKNYRERLKIDVPTSAHSLRHGFATYLAESGANPAAIQILLDHESLDTTT